MDTLKILIFIGLFLATSAHADSTDWQRYHDHFNEDPSYTLPLYRPSDPSVLARLNAWRGKRMQIADDIWVAPKELMDNELVDLNVNGPNCSFIKEGLVKVLRIERRSLWEKDGNIERDYAVVQYRENHKGIYPTSCPMGRDLYFRVDDMPAIKVVE